MAPGQQGSQWGRARKWVRLKGLTNVAGTRGAKMLWRVPELSRDIMEKTT